MTTFTEKGVIRPPNPDAPNEIIRMMPRGVRDALITTAPGDMSSGILTWCLNRNLITVSRRRGQVGEWIHTTQGKAVIRQLNQRMKGFV